MLTNKEKSIIKEIALKTVRKINYIIEYKLFINESVFVIQFFDDEGNIQFSYIIGRFIDEVIIVFYDGEQFHYSIDRLLELLDF